MESGGGCFPQVSGIRFTYDLSQPVGNRIASIEVKSNRGYQSIDLEAVYKVAVNSFLSEGNDGYQVFKQAISSKDLGYMQYDVVTEYITKHSPVNPQLEGRINGSNLNYGA
ncbi:5'-nucleotidase C-terminal domain-containing protein [Desulfallas thermosapovorans]|uniref:5'-nucleotidase C-terminal domain-containing protein n=1 Tax=Desulfallas thermosapovorans TaxID=58137 RepID=UPI001413151E|nr:5'-nucleotidase C-terminal domain-containing protein [Desulfallas thermosapovorans]